VDAGQKFISARGLPKPQYAIGSFSSGQPPTVGNIGFNQPKPTEFKNLPVLPNVFDKHLLSRHQENLRAALELEVRQGQLVVVGLQKAEKRAEEK
jgi:hypothetical protein